MQLQQITHMHKVVALRPYQQVLKIKDRKAVLVVFLLLLLVVEPDLEVNRDQFELEIWKI